MNILMILLQLLCMMISYAAGEVSVPTSEVSASHGQSINLLCTVTAPDTFDKWDNALYTSSIENDPNLEFTQTGNQHDIKIKSMDVLLAGVWTCYSKEGNNDSIILDFAPSVVTPTVTKQSLIKDRPGMISINIRGYPHPDFTWKKDGVVLNITGRYSLAYNGSLLISNVESGDGGVYSADAQKVAFSASSGDITVNILVAPSITGTSIRENRTIGGSIEFRCPATGVPPPNVTWEKDSNVISNGGRYNVSASKLQITDVQPSDVGDYTCVAENIVGSEKLTSTLMFVHVPPVIAPFPVRKEVEKEKSLTVNCNATGSPAPTVDWSRNGNSLSSIQQMKSPGKSVLKLASVQEDGIYECSATNGAVNSTGTIIKRRRTIQINVVYSPVFEKVKETVFVRLGGPITITCNASGIPVPEIKLAREGKEIKADTAQDSVSSSLLYRINKTSTNDIGEYTCVARNKLKSVQKDVTLTVPLDRPEIKDVQPTCDGVSFSWTHDKQGYTVVKEYKLSVTRTANGKLAKVLVVSANSSQKSFTGLDEDTEYELAVKQMTGDVNIGLTATKVTTTTTCPLKNIRNATVNENTVTIYWPEVPKDNVKYIIKYKSKDSPDWLSKQTDKIYMELSGLDYGKTYMFQVFYDVDGKIKELTEIRNVTIPPRPSSTSAPTGGRIITERSTLTTTEPTTEKIPPGVAARKKGLSGGAIAAIVIVIILLVLIAVDIFCCFFNQCGVVHMCAAACSGKGREKYTVDGSPEEGTKLKEIDEEGKDDPGA